MQVREAMTNYVQYVRSGTTLTEAAKKMAESDCGFLPISDVQEGRLEGVITDRDIAIRAVAEGLDPNRTSVEQIKTDKVLYCFEDEDLDAAAESMRGQHVYRLIVLDNRSDKRLSGVISLGDIIRHHQEQLASKAAKGIAAAAA